MEMRGTRKEKGGEKEEGGKGKGLGMGVQSPIPTGG